jgi:ribonuclease HII
MATICGLDEAGRGALAGPLTAAAVVIPDGNFPIPRDIKIKDSKLLNSRQRNKVYRWIVRKKIPHAVETVSARQINTRGIGYCNKLVFKKLIKKITADEYIVDDKIKIKSAKRKVKSVVDADAQILPCILAGIVAKVTRDKLMTELGRQPRFKKYRWRINKGYGTKTHLEALKKHGKSRYHRDVFVTTALRGKI